MKPLWMWRVWVGGWTREWGHKYNAVFKTFKHFSLNENPNRKQILIASVEICQQIFSLLNRRCRGCGGEGRRNVALFPKTKADLSTIWQKKCYKWHCVTFSTIQCLNNRICVMKNDCGQDEDGEWVSESERVRQNKIPRNSKWIKDIVGLKTEWRARSRGSTNLNWNVEKHARGKCVFEHCSKFIFVKFIFQAQIYRIQFLLFGKTIFDLIFVSFRCCFYSPFRRNSSFSCCFSSIGFTFGANAPQWNNSSNLAFKCDDNDGQMKEIYRSNQFHTMQFHSVEQI